MSTPSPPRPGSSHSTYFTPPSGSSSLPQHTPSPSPRRSPYSSIMLGQVEDKSRSVSDSTYRPGNGRRRSSQLEQHQSGGSESGMSRGDSSDAEFGQRSLPISRGNSESQPSKLQESQMQKTVSKGIPVSTRRISEVSSSQIVTPRQSSSTHPSIPHASTSGLPRIPSTTPTRPVPGTSLSSGSIPRAEPITLPPESKPAAGPSRNPSSQNPLQIAVSQPTPTMSPRDAAQAGWAVPFVRRRTSSSSLQGQANGSPRRSSASGIPIPSSLQPGQPSGGRDRSSGSSTNSYRRPLSPTPASPMHYQHNTAFFEPQDSGLDSTKHPGRASTETTRSDGSYANASGSTITNRVNIVIPNRSTSSMSGESSPTKSSNFPPQISPRKSSMSVFPQDNLGASRRKSSQASAYGQPIPTSPNLSRVSSSSSSIRTTPSRTTRKSLTSPTISSAAKMSTPFKQTSPTPDRRSPKHSPRSSPRHSPSNSPRLSSSRTGSPLVGTNSSPRLGTPRATPGNSPRPDRKSPGLTIQPPPPGPMRQPSQMGRPSPPVPARSPLRGLPSQKSSFSELHIKANRPETALSGSGESNVAEGGTPTTSEPASATSTQLSIPFPERMPTGSIYEGKTPDEIRFTMMTAPSVYSQDSAPSSATWPASAEIAMTPVTAGEQRDRLTRMNSISSWGTKKDFRGSLGETEDGSSLRDSRSSSLARLSMPDKALPTVPSDSPQTSATVSTLDSNLATNGHTPVTPFQSNNKPSPLQISPTPATAPSTSKATRVLGMGDGDMKITRTPPHPTTTLLPAPPLISPKVASLRPTLPRSTSTASLSKRGHLIREIAHTERAYANDLALIRDAYLFRFSRPHSHHSTNGDSSVSPATDSSRRGSIHTYQMGEMKRSSGHSGHDSISGVWGPNSAMLFGPGGKSPASEGAPRSSPYGSSTPLTSSASSSSFLSTPQPSPRNSLLKVASSDSPHGSSPGLNGRMPGIVGKPLSSSDLKAVFLNLEHLAAAAEDLATGFEKAMGEEEAGPGALTREGEGGSDRLGEVFMSLLPKIQPLYNFYCARQSQASTRLMEIQTDPGHQAYLNDCWALVKPHTHAWNLDSMLIKPVQRITKYPLLFDDLLACTSPVHPDYFAIRSAAEASRSVAIEIDEAKRRKDVVERVIGGKKVSPSGPPSLKDGKSGNQRLLGLKRFRKDKTNGSSSSLGTLGGGSEVGTPADIPPSSFASYKEAVTRLEDYDHCVRMLGKEILVWTGKAKEVFVVERDMMTTWARVVQLEPSDVVDHRIVAFRQVTEKIVASAWRELDCAIRDHVMPALSKLLLLAVSPRTVINRRDSKVVDYSKYTTARESKRPVDRQLLQSASEFVAMHTQLVEELPAFLEGYTRIFDLIVAALARVQAKFNAAIRDRLSAFLEEWISTPRRKLSGVVTLDEEIYDISTARGIIEAWHSAWTPYADAMDHFQCTRPARYTASRVASFNNQPGGHAASINSRSNSPAPMLRHSSSITSNHSRTNSVRRPEPNRNRSTSLIGQSESDKPMSLIRADSRFAMLRRNSKGYTKNGDRNDSPNAAPPVVMGPPSSSSPLQKRPVSTASASDRDPNQRYSFGLPQISSNQPMFDDGLGLSPVKSHSMNGRNGQQHHPRSAASEPLRSSSSPDPSRPHPFSEFGTDPSKLRVADRNAGLGLGDFDDNMERGISNSSTNRQRVEVQGSKNSHASSSSNSPIPPVQSQTTRPSRATEIDASEGWRNEKVIYQCACVADFDPVELGDKKYRGLRFLTMEAGDLIDVFHEVGRIDQLPAFPYTDIGVDNDGVLVGRTEGGAIGLVICSFLEPLRE